MSIHTNTAEVIHVDFQHDNVAATEGKGAKMSYTTQPDYIYDCESLDVYEIAMMGLIYRKTMGFGKRSDGISISQFMRSLGIGNKKVISTIKALQDKNLILVTRSKKANGAQSFNIYTPVIYPEWGSASGTQGVVSEEHRQKETNTKENRQDIKDNAPPAEDQDINALKGSLPLKKEWMQDSRMKDAFRTILQEYDVNADAKIWSLVAGDFVDYWSNINPNLAKAKKKAWVDTFRNHVRKQADRNAWRWKKNQDANPQAQSAPDQARPTVEDI